MLLKVCLLKCGRFPSRECTKKQITEKGEITLKNNYVMTFFLLMKID